MWEGPCCHFQSHFQGSCGPFYSHPQCLCVFPVRSAFNAARLHLFLGRDYMWDERIILSVWPWLPYFPQTFLSLLHHKLNVHPSYDRDLRTGSCCYQNTTPTQLAGHSHSGKECHQELSWIIRVRWMQHRDLGISSYEDMAGYDDKLCSASLDSY